MGGGSVSVKENGTGPDGDDDSGCDDDDDATGCDAATDNGRLGSDTGSVSTSGVEREGSSNAWEQLGQVTWRSVNPSGTGTVFMHTGQISLITAPSSVAGRPRGTEKRPAGLR